MRVDIQLLIKKMTLRQKIAQMTQLVPDFFDTDESGVVTGPLASFGISKADLAMIGSVLGSYDGETLYRLQKKHMAQDPLKIPLLFMGDVIHGLKTIFPIPLALGATFNPETVEKVAAISAIESSEAGLHVTFSPMADLVRDIRWGRVMESTGEDPYLNGLMSEAFVKGYQGTPGELLINRYKIAATLKHFAGYGAVEAGRDYTKAELSEHSLREYYLSGYKAAIDAGVELVMTAFNTVDDIPATANKHLMLDLLRGELGFKGVLISDWGAVTELIAHGVAADYKAAAKLAIEARVDIEMMTPAYLQSLEDLVTTGIVSERQIDQAVLGILTLKEKLGLFADPYRGYEQQLSNDYQFRTLSLPHRIQARQAAEESFVLLKNGILPLKNLDTRILLAGPVAQSTDILGTWQAAGDQNEAVSVYDGLKTIYSNLTYAESLVDFEKQVDKYDVIILALGETSDQSGEAASRAYPTLSDEQVELVNVASKTGKPVVALIFSGRPLILSDIENQIVSLLQVWMPGTEGGNAIANVLSGKTIPSGKLPMSFPRAIGQIPIYYNNFRTGRPWTKKNQNEKYISRYIDESNCPLFPFGYGLSYSEFNYDSLALTQSSLHKGQTLCVSINLTNIGPYDSYETVQLYIKDEVAEVARPVKALKKIQKIWLESGQTKSISFELNEQDLAYHHIDHSFYADEGAFTLFVGGDSETNLQTTFTYKEEI